MSEAVKNPPENMPRITSSIFYDDPRAALDWLEKAFGFKRRLVIDGPDGGVVHSEMEFADGVIFVGPSTAFPETRSAGGSDGTVTQGLYVYVDDVDAHCEKARKASAEIVREPEDQFYGDRNYSAFDCEGHRWTFGQHVKDIAGGDMVMPEGMTSEG